MRKPLKLFLILLISLGISVPVGSVILVYLGIYLKHQTGYLTDNIYLFINEGWVFTTSLDCNASLLPTVMRYNAKVAVLHNELLIVGYNPEVLEVSEMSNYKLGYFVIDYENYKSYIGVDRKKYEELLESLNVRNLVNYKFLYEYIDIPTYKMEKTEPQNNGNNCTQNAG